ncbi:hypothetical protein K7432_008889 [Basidiobolus ranarum]|uniref:Cytochrome P450 n=1 Tax=Basidiobolus ranarum TaxID=34480 RepID=A0ABR2WR52_9FUNG
MVVPVSWEIFSLSVFVILVGYLCQLKYYSTKSTLPCVRGLPFVGSTLSLFTSQDYFIELVNKYGAIFRIHILGQDVVAVTKKEHISMLLNGENKFTFNSMPKIWQRVLGPNSLSVVTGTHHTNLKVLMKRAFSHEALNGYVPTIKKHFEQFMKEKATTGEIWNVVPVTRKLFMGMALDIEMGTTMTAEELLEFHTQFTDLFLGLAAVIPYELPGTALKTSLNARKWIIERCTVIIEKRKQRLANGESIPYDMLQHLIEDEVKGQKLSTDEIIDQMIVVIFATLDTVASTISNLLHNIQYVATPDMVEKLYTEARGHQNIDDIVWRKATSMPILEAFILETLRLTPPAGGGVRRINEDITLAGHQFKKDQAFLWMIGPAHQDEALYSDPAQFSPQRFLKSPWIDEQGAPSITKGGAYTFLSFGGGTRLCLGQQLGQLMLRMFMTMFLRHHEYEVVGKSKPVFFPFTNKNINVRMTYVADAQQPQASN